MVMIGDGTTANVKDSISKLGTNMLILRVGQEKKVPPKEDNSSKPFEEADILAIKNEVQNIKLLSAENSTTINVVYGNRSNNGTSVVGTNNDYFIIKRLGSKEEYLMKWIKKVENPLVLLEQLLLNNFWWWKSNWYKLRL